MAPAQNIVDSGQKISSRIVKFVFQVSRVCFREKKSQRLRPYQNFLSVLDRNFFGSLVKVSQLARQNCCGDVYRDFRMKKIYEFFAWMIFEFRAKKFWTFSKKFSANLSTLHSTHPDSFSETKGVFNFFDQTNLAIFFRKLIEKVADFGRRVFSGLAFQRRFQQNNVFLKNVLEFFSDLEPTEFRTFANLFSMGGGVLERQSTCQEYPLKEN